MKIPMLFNYYVGRSLISAGVINRLVGIFIVLVLLSTGAAAYAALMPNFILPSVVDGEDVNSNEFKGKVLLVTFFATWCGPCLQEIPTLIRLQNELSKKGFSVIGLSVDKDGRYAVKELVEKEKVNYPVLLSNHEATSGFGRISLIPTSFLINNAGEVVGEYHGHMGYQQLKQDIAPLLTSKSAERRKTVIIIHKMIEI
ncbi:MAG: TlpA family protein disulfide reductase [Candidatus Electrothrix sp. GM3_4]|nr:TlpA family protein disulfide reductase [Candidatus Electrothrix sp. GM3_4]